MNKNINSAISGNILILLLHTAALFFLIFGVLNKSEPIGYIALILIIVCFSFDIFAILNLDIKKSSISSLSQRNTELQAEVMKSTNAMREIYLESIIKGNFSTDKLSMDKLEYCGVKFFSDDFLIIIIEILDSGSNDRLECLDDTDFNLIESELQLEFERILNQKHKAYYFAFEGNMAVLLNIAGMSGDYAKSRNSVLIEIHKTVEKGKELLESELGIILGIAISDTCVGISGISRIFYKLLEYTGANLNNGVVIDQHMNTKTYNDFSEPQPISDDKGILQGIVPHTELQKKYYSAILDKDFNMAASIVQQIINDELEDYAKSFALNKRIRDRINTAIYISFLGIEENESQVKLFSELSQNAFETTNIEDIKNGVKIVFDGLKNYFIFDKDESIISKIKEYIDNNYSDMTLNVSKVCDEFHFSLSYLTHFFKQETGIKMLDYIHTVRIVEVKRLLKETDLTLSEISTMTGYYSGWTLTRVFRRYEGITPVAYRSKVTADKAVF